MHVKRIHDMIEKLTKCAETEFEKGIDNVNADEMGEVTDMIKDLCEAEYYAKISKAMDEAEYGEDYDYMGAYDEYSRKSYRGQPRSKTSGRYMSRGDGRRNNGGRRGYEETMGYYEMTPEMYRDMDRESMGRMYYTDSVSHVDIMGARDMREGRNGQSRKSYMESKEMHKSNTPEDKEAKRKELDKWMSDIGADIKELVHDMTPEEKTTAKTKLTNLANSL